MKELSEFIAALIVLAIFKRREVCAAVQRPLLGYAVVVKCLPEHFNL